MLVELMVENYAVVERLRVRFHPGLNLLTGETGSGKSIVVDALGLLFGGRASADMVRSGARRARVSGIFEAPRSRALAAALEGAGIELEDGEILIEREILATGKSRAFAGSRPVTLALLREIAPHLGDIHGQHDQQRLFLAETQREILDTFGGHAAALDEVSALHAEWRGVTQELDRLATSEQERLRLADLWSFQRREIEDAAPQADEDEALEHERRVLRNVAQLEEHTNAAYSALYESAESAVTRIGQAWHSLDEASRFDDSLAALRDTLKPAEIVVEETAHELRHYLGRLEANPNRLEEVESRLAALEKLKRKYGATIAEILEFLDEVRANLAVSDSSEQRFTELERRRDELAVEFRAAAGKLTALRREAAGKLERRLVAELRSLAMERTVFRIEVEPADWSETGVDRIRYLVSPNPGEDPRPMEKVASGGELSRIALALKTCATTAPKSRSKRQLAIRTLVFDEVDSGVGGGAAETVGRRLKQIAASNQVLCVTHLPQIAGFADHHYHVAKSERGGRAVASVVELDEEARTREIGRMLSGRKLTPEAIGQAEQLIRLARQ